MCWWGVRGVDRGWMPLSTRPQLYCQHCCSNAVVVSIDSVESRVCRRCQWDQRHFVVSEDLVPFRNPSGAVWGRTFCKHSEDLVPSRTPSDIAHSINKGHLLSSLKKCFHLITTVGPRNSSLAFKGSPSIKVKILRSQIVVCNVTSPLFKGYPDIKVKNLQSQWDRWGRVLLYHHLWKRDAPKGIKLKYSDWSNLKDIF